MGKWLSENWWWLLAAIASVAYFADHVQGRRERGESGLLSVLYTLMPFLEPDSRARQFMWVDVFGKIFFAAIVIAILVAGYLFF